MIIWNGPPNAGLNAAIKDLYSHLTALSKQTCFLLSQDGGLWLTDLTYVPPNLVDLDLSGCARLRIVSCRLPRSTRTASLAGCLELQRIRHPLPQGLETLDVSDCPQLEELPSVPLTLKSLTVRNCPALRSIPSLPPGCTLDNSGCGAAQQTPDPSLCWFRAWLDRRAA